MTAGRTILVVDDEASVRDLVTRYLTREGYQVAAAEDGATALTLARRARLRDPHTLAEQLLLLMDGAWVAARMFGPRNPAAHVAAAAAALIDAHKAA